MRRFVEPLMLIFLNATHADLVRQIQYLRVENRILRSKLPARITLTDPERQRLVRFGRPLRSALQHIVSIVSYPTFRRWLRPKDPKVKTRKPGRPRKPEELRQLVIRLASENRTWGYTRLLGELAKLGITDLSRATLRNILREAGLEPAPLRGEPTWNEFMFAHAKTLWACDYFTKTVWTRYGLRTAHVLFFLHIKSRKVIVTPATLHPTASWSTRQAEVFVEQARAQGFESPTILLRDGDKKFGVRFNAALRRHGCRAKRLTPDSPQLNAFAERWIGSLKRECLDHFVAFGRKHLDHLVSEYVEHYHAERPHQGMGNRVLRPPVPGSALGLAGSVVCQSRLGGLLRHYRRAA